MGGGLLRIHGERVKGRVMIFASSVQLRGGARASQRGGLKSRSSRGSKRGCVNWSPGARRRREKCETQRGKHETNHLGSRSTKGRCPFREQGKLILRTQRAAISRSTTKSETVV